MFFFILLSHWVTHLTHPETIETKLWTAVPVLSIFQLARNPKRQVNNF
jgi:hypothetical protein